MTLPKSILIIALILGISLGVLTAMQNKKSVEQKVVFGQLNGKPIQLEVADSAAEQYQGLSDRETLCDNCGMIFLYPDPRPLTFVMRRMNFPLDIVWIREGEIIGINYNLAPEHTDPYVPYSSPDEADTVLELKAGGARMYNLEKGQLFNITAYDKTK